MSNAMRQSPRASNAEAPDVFVMAMWPTTKPAPIQPYSRETTKARPLKESFLLRLHTSDSQGQTKNAGALNTFSGRPNRLLAKP